MKRKGSQSIEFVNPPYILGEASVVGKKESEGPIGQYFHEVCEDPLLGMDTWEEAESQLTKKSTNLALFHAGLRASEIGRAHV